MDIVNSSEGICMWLFIAIFAISFIVAMLGYRYLLKHKEIKILKKKNETGERFASQSKPIVGGIMFFFCFAIGFIASLFAGNAAIENLNYGALLVGTTIAFVMGFTDDLKEFSPLFKLIFQILCVAILIVSGVHIATSDNIILNYLLTFFWVVGIMNSINMLDNMDGVTASISGIIFAGIAVIAFACGNISDATVLVAMIACISAFLTKNWFPSKMYMGDNGSQLLGFLLSYFSIKYVWNSGNPEGFNYEQILFIALMFLVPLTDTATVAINRFLAGRSPFVGDRFHTTHNLVYKGLSIPRTVIILDLVTIIGTASSVCYIIFANSQISLLNTAILAIYIVIVFSYAYITNLKIRIKNDLLFKHNE